MSAAALLLATAGLLVAGGGLESVAHRRRLRRIPVRIHVNGTRGKSSVTRLIAAGLRASGIRTCAKTTGTLPRMILPDGTELPIFRPSRPNVIEQLRIVDTAADFGAEAMVVECMALIPYLQWLSEARLVQATHGVITNAREDLFTAEKDHLDVFRAAAAERKSQLIAVSDEEIARIRPLDLAGFMYLEHAENIALALRVCEDLGVDRATALQGMWAAKPDPGAMTAHEMEFFGRQINFVNGFAANDPESTLRIWQIALERYPDVEKRIAVFNCRADRPERSRQLGRAVVDWPPADHYLLIGGGTYIFARAAIAEGLDSLKLFYGEDRRVEEIFETVVELSGTSSLVMGMANIGGGGLDLVRYFANRSKLRVFK
jgi:UDP-N-acetylmuramoylalanine-D-glutamate ligase